MRKAVIVFLLLSAIFSIAQRSNRRLMLANNPSASAECVVTTNALVVTSLASFGNTSNSSSYATASVNPAADATLILFAAISPVGTETVTNTGTTQLTWWALTNKSYNTIASPAHEAVAWISQMPPGTASFAMQVVLGNTSGTGANMHLLQVTGADTNQSWGSNAVVQIVTAVSNATANPQITITAPNAGASNAVLVAFADDLNATTDNAAGSGTTELAETAYNTPAAGLSSYYRLNAPASMTLATNIATARDWSAVALEIKAGTNNCGAGGGGGGNPAFVSFTKTDSGSGTAITNQRTITTGNLIVVGSKWENVTAGTTVTDTAGNTYTPLTLASQASDVRTRLYYAKNVTGGTVTITNTFDASVDFSAICVWEFSGCSTTAPFDCEGTGAGSSANPASSSCTPGQANSALVCIIGNFNGSTTTEQGSWTENADVSGNSWEAQHRIVTSAASYQGAGTLSGSGSWAISFAAFK